MTTSVQAPHQRQTITFLDETGKSWQFTAVDVLPTTQTDDDTRHLILQLGPIQFQNIQKVALFHLKPELQESPAGANFNAEDTIEITLALNPQLLDLLAEQQLASQPITAYLFALSQRLTADLSEQPSEIPTPEATSEPSVVPSPLLRTNSWFALHVKQQQPDAEVRYRTFWSYLSPAALAKEVASGGQISAAMGHLFQNLAHQEGGAAEAAISEAVDELFQDLGAWVDEQLSSTEATFTALADEIGQALETWLTSDSSSEALRPSKQPIYRAMLTFFSDDDWTFTKLKGESTLQLAFQGEHGQWNCYAVARDEQAQFLFYSVHPTPVPEQHRLAIAEYLTRANYGLVQGNFEFDFSSGKIQYKTGLDVTHLSINPKVLQQLVYTNVAIMDHYLPGILAVAEQGMDPKAAIQEIEG